MNIDHGINQFGWKSADAELAHTYLLPAILKLLPENKHLTILDAGCGNGYIAGKMAELGHSVIGIDLAEDGIAIARQAYPHIRFEVASVYEDLRRIAADVDLVISSEVIEHLFYPRAYLTNIWRVLHPGGSLIITTPYHGYIKNILIALLGYWDKHHSPNQEGGHIKFFSRKTISELLLETGFSEITFNNAGRIPWVWKSMVCRVKKHA